MPYLYYKIGRNRYVPLSQRARHYRVILKQSDFARTLHFTNKQHMIPNVPVVDFPSSIPEIFNILNTPPVFSPTVWMTRDVLESCTGCSYNAILTFLSSRKHLDGHDWTMPCLSLEAALLVYCRDKIFGAIINF